MCWLFIGPGTPQPLSNCLSLANTLEYNTSNKYCIPLVGSRIPFVCVCVADKILFAWQDNNFDACVAHYIVQFA